MRILHVCDSMSHIKEESSHNLDPWDRFMTIRNFNIAKKLHPTKVIEREDGQLFAKIIEPDDSEATYIVNRCRAKVKK